MASGRQLLNYDGWFELILAALLLFPALAGADLEDAFGVPAWAVIAVGVGLTMVGIALLLAEPDPSTLLAVGGVNGIGAFALGGYLALLATEMNGFGIGVVATAAAGLVVLATLELKVARADSGRLMGGH